MATNEDINVRVKVDTANSTAQINTLNSKVDGLNDGLGRAGKSASDVAASVGNAGKKMTGMALAGAGLIAVLANSAGKFQQMQVALTTSFGGDDSAAGVAMKTIQDFANKTPYALNEVLQGFLKLKNMGLDPSTEALESYGNTASSMGKSLNDMVEAVADAATGEFERLKEFGIKASSQGDQVAFTFQGVTTTVKNNSEAIQGYLLEIGNTKFAGGMEAQSKTFLGVMSTMQDSMTMLINAIGTPLLEPLSQLALKLGELASKATAFMQANPAIAELVGKILLFGTVILGVLGPLTIFLSFLPAMYAGLMLLVSPWGLIIGGIVALIAVVGYLIYKWDEFKAAVVTIAGMVVDFVVQKFHDLSAFMQEHMSFVYNAIMFGWNAIMFFIEPVLAAFELLFFGNGERIKAIFQGVWDAVVSVVRFAWEGLKAIHKAGLDALLAFVNFMIQPYVNAFNVIWGAIGGVVTAGANFVLDIVKSMVNGMITMINMALRGLNSLASAASKATGIKFSKIPEIPQLAEGGIVNKPTLALIGEAGPEAVVPLSKGKNYGVGGSTIVFNFNGTVSSREVAMEYMDIAVRELKLSSSVV